MAKPERGMLFCGPMILGLLAGRKTVTRRLKPLPVGTVIWLREQWATEAQYDVLPPRDLPAPARVWYLADGPKPAWCGRPRRGRHLPRRLARPDRWIVDAVTEERLQDITEAQAMAEGVSVLELQEGLRGAWYEAAPGVAQARTAVGSFAVLWNSLHPTPGERWAANPIVCPHTLRRLA